MHCGAGRRILENAAPLKGPLVVLGLSVGLVGYLLEELTSPFEFRGLQGVGKE